MLGEPGLTLKHSFEIDDGQPLGRFPTVLIPKSCCIRCELARDLSRSKLIAILSFRINGLGPLTWQVTVLPTKAGESTTELVGKATVLPRASWLNPNAVDGAVFRFGESRQIQADILVYGKHGELLGQPAVVRTGDSFAINVGMGVDHPTENVGDFQCRRYPTTFSIPPQRGVGIRMAEVRCTWPLLNHTMNAVLTWQVAPPLIATPKSAIFRPGDQSSTIELSGAEGAHFQLTKLESPAGYEVQSNINLNVPVEHASLRILASQNSTSPVRNCEELRVTTNLGTLTIPVFRLGFNHPTLAVGESP